MNLQQPERLDPIDIKIDKDFLLIEWSDLTKSKFDFSTLRFMCPCAVCIDEFTNVRKITKEQIALDIKPLKAQLVGHYGMNILWSDKHSTGIYTWDYLLSLR